MEKLAIIGCGTMGHSIALSAALAGLKVKLYGLNFLETERAQRSIIDKLNVLSENGLLDLDNSELVTNRIIFTHSISELAEGTSFIIETIPENLEMKRDIFLYLDKICDVDVILASNTSGLSPSKIASGTLNPQRIVVTHFWNPAHLIPLVEVVRGIHTSDQTIKRAFDLLKCMNKKPIEVKKESPGFVGNRLQFALLREAQYILEQGIASKEDIDAAVTFGIGRRLSATGPFISADMGGLDVFSAISDYLLCELSNAKNASPELKKLVEENKFGVKTGEGYYKWDKLFIEKMNQKREKDLIHFFIQDSEVDKPNL